MGSEDFPASIDSKIISYDQIDACQIADDSKTLTSAPMDDELAIMLFQTLNRRVIAFEDNRRSQMDSR